MKRLLYTVLSVAMWCVIVAYFVFASGLNRKEKEQLRVEKVEVRIRDAHKVHVVSEKMVSEWLGELGSDLVNTEMSGVNTERIRQLIAGKPFVKDVRVFSDMRGVLHVELSQRKPVARFSTDNGYNFYYSDDNWILPVPFGSAMRVPVITGSFKMPFERGFYGSLDDSIDDAEKKGRQDYAFMLNLINFVTLTAEDNFWNSQIVQIVVTDKGTHGRWREPEIEIVPRIGNFVVSLGTLADVPKKLDRLMLFYRNVLPYEGWDNYRYINLKYDGQVVCTK